MFADESFRERGGWLIVNCVIGGWRRVESVVCFGGVAMQIRFGGVWKK